jgi:hypothetical protein
MYYKKCLDLRLLMDNAKNITFLSFIANYKLISDNLIGIMCDTHAKSKNNE